MSFCERDSSRSRPPSRRSLVARLQAAGAWPWSALLVCLVACRGGHDVAAPAEEAGPAPPDAAAVVDAGDAASLAADPLMAVATSLCSRLRCRTPTIDVAVYTDQVGEVQRLVVRADRRVCPDAPAEVFDVDGQWLARARPGPELDRMMVGLQAAMPLPTIGCLAP